MSDEKGTGAYRSIDSQVVDAWEEYKARADAVMDARRAMADHYGRDLWVERNGFGHGSRVVAFEKLDTDPEGLPPELRLMASGRVQPNLARKAGKQLNVRLVALAFEGPKLPGMPQFALVGSEAMVGVRSIAPALDRYDDRIYASWGEPSSSVQGTYSDELWEPIPLSAYHAAREAHEAAQRAVEAGD